MNPHPEQALWMSRLAGSRQPVIALGVISGTSADGIDVAALRTDGEQLVEPLHAGATYPYTPALRERLLQAMRSPPEVGSRSAQELETATTQAHCQAVRQFIDEHAIHNIALLGMHGQTIQHQPLRSLSWQLLDGALAAQSLSLPVVCDFRSQDVAAGGQGAPLVPLFHQALARPLEQPLMVLNWGGVGNVTYIHGDELLAFDTGPANALLDDWVRQHTGQDFDQDGRLSAAGVIDQALLASWLQHDYFKQAPPKSLDRHSFHFVLDSLRGKSVEDGAATLAAFTVAATACAQQLKPARRWLVAGGGRLNRTLMQRLQTTLGVEVQAVEAVGWQGDSLEAQCFAYLAVRSVRGLALSLPSTTGVKAAQTGGSLHWPH